MFHVILNTLLFSFLIVLLEHREIWMVLELHVRLWEIIVLKGNYCCGREIELWKKLSQSDWERLITLHLRIVVCYKVLESPK